MICKNCGKQVPDGARFCRFCGTALTEEPATKKERVCPACGETGEENQLYCDKCGTLLVERTVKAAVSIPKKKQPENSGKPAEIKRFQLYSLYNGDVAIGIAQASGTLIVCQDRLVFEKKLGNPGKMLFGLAGIVSSRAEISKNPVTTFLFSEIASANMSKYVGIYDAVVLTLCDGSSVTLVPPVPGLSSPTELYDLICRGKGW